MNDFNWVIPDFSMQPFLYEAAEQGVVALSGSYTIGPGSVVLFTEDTEGGLIIGSDNQISNLFKDDSSGQLRIGGSGNDVIVYRQIQCESTSCGCSALNFLVLGSLGVKATATVVWERIGQGGLTLKGKTRVVSNNNGYVGLNWLLPLGSREQDPVELVQDLVTAGNELVQDVGVFCLPSSRFTSEDLSNVIMERDTLAVNQAFALSFWVRADNRFKQRCLFSRGFFETLNGGKWSVKISLGHYGQIVLATQDSAGEQDETISDAVITEDRWSHVAISYSKQIMSLYVDGVYQESLTLENPLPISNGNSIGVWEKSSFPDCWLQEFRCYDSAKSADYFLAEHDNFCDFQNFVIMSGRQTAGVS